MNNVKEIVDILVCNDLPISEVVGRLQDSKWWKKWLKDSPPLPEPKSLDGGQHKLPGLSPEGEDRVLNQYGKPTTSASEVDYRIRQAKLQQAKEDPLGFIQYPQERRYEGAVHVERLPQNVRNHLAKIGVTSKKVRLYVGSHTLGPTNTTHVATLHLEGKRPDKVHQHKPGPLEIFGHPKPIPTKAGFAHLRVRQGEWTRMGDGTWKQETFTPELYLHYNDADKVRKWSPKLGKVQRQQYAFLRNYGK
jgi:hypothetical protein